MSFSARFVEGTKQTRPYGFVEATEVINPSNAKEFGAALDASRVYDDGKLIGRVVVNLAGVDRMHQTGMRELNRVLMDCGKSGDDVGVVLVGLSSEVRRKMERVGFVPYCMKAFDNLDAALASPIISRSETSN